MEHISQEERNVIGEKELSEYFDLLIDCANPLTQICSEDLDTYEKRRDVMNEYYFNNSLRRSGSFMVIVPKMIAVGMIEHEARKIKNIIKKRKTTA